MQKDSATSFPERETIELPELTSDRRARSALVPAIVWMAVVSIGAGAIYAMYFRSVARASGAVRAEQLSSSAPGDPARLSEFLFDGRDQLPAMRAAMSQWGQQLRALMSYSVCPQIPLAGLKCNPFHQPDPSSVDRARPTTNPAPEAERAAMLQAVEAMQLQSILCTDTHRSCTINNALYDEGGLLNGFTIEQINPQTVVIRNGLYRFELTMNH